MNDSRRFRSGIKLEPHGIWNIQFLYEFDFYQDHDGGAVGASGRTVLCRRAILCWGTINMGAILCQEWLLTCRTISPPQFSHADFCTYVCVYNVKLKNGDKRIRILIQQIYPNIERLIRKFKNTQFNSV